MLDEESVQTYKRICLSRDLRPEVLARHTEKHAPHPIRYGMRTAAALCSVLLIAAVLFTAVLHNKPGIYTSDGVIRNESRTALMETVPFTGGLMRASLDVSARENPVKNAANCVLLRLSYGQDVTITVSGGALLLPLDNGSFAYAGAFGAVKNETALYWSAEECEENSPLTAVILAENGSVIDTVTLTYNAADGIWQIANSMSDK